MLDTNDCLSEDRRQRGSFRDRGFPSRRSRLEEDVIDVQSLLQRELVEQSEKRTGAL